MSPDPSGLVPEVSFTVRDYCESVLLDTASGFNYWYPLACNRYGVRPVRLSLRGNPATLFRGRYDWVSLQRIVGINDGLYAVLSVGGTLGIGNNNLKVTPSAFSGNTPISIDFYAVQKTGTLPPDGDAQYFAIESALIASFNAEHGAKPVPMGVSYNNEINMDPGAVEWDGSQFLQVISVTLLFNRITYGF